jgi:hypothetical protein
VRTTIQIKQRNRFFLWEFDDQANGIAAGHVDLKAVLHGTLQRRDRMRFQQPQHFDEFTSSVADELRFQTASQNAETHRKIPVFQRSGVIESARFSL